jgi:DNA (cytosine-5)-methyltransferase 1
MPDMKLYAEIVFLSTYFKGKWVVENVKPYYEPLIKPAFELHRHLFWANFTATQKDFKKSEIRSKNKISDFDGYEVVAESKIGNKRQVLRNCVDPELGAHILGFV